MKLAARGRSQGWDPSCCCFLRQIVWVGLLLRRNRPIDLKVGLCRDGGFAQYLPPFDSDIISVRDYLP